MKVKVGDKIHDSEYEPAMVILSEKDKENISNMNPKSNSYCVYPDGEEWTKNDHEKNKGMDEGSSRKKKKNKELATLEDWYAKLDKPCQKS